MNLKPPLSFLAIIAGYKLAGFHALGLRFLSACFAMFTIIMVGAFVYKKYGNLASVLRWVYTAGDTFVFAYLKQK